MFRYTTCGCTKKQHARRVDARHSIRNQRPPFISCVLSTEKLYVHAKAIYARLFDFDANCSGSAQSAATGDLHVTVKDPKGNVVTNATVTASDAAKAFERTVTGSPDGEYRVVSLPPGIYVITVETQGFAKTTSNDVIISVGGMTELPVTLSVAGGQEVVNVTSEAAPVETTRSSTTDTVDQKRIDNLPINGRNYINFTLTDSQVVRDNAPNTGAAPTSGLNMSGQRARSNLVNVDGADATDNSVNGVRSTVSQEAVQEFQIITNSYSAEYGRAAGGVVNIITRSGSNAFHGDVFGYLRNRNFQAVNPFSTTPDPAYTRVQGGVAFGGAIKKDKTFYYFSYEVTRRHETGFSSIGQGNFGLSPFDTTQVGLPFGTLQLTPDQIGFFTNPTVLAAEANPAIAGVVGQYAAILGASSGMAVNGAWPIGMGAQPGFISSCQTPGTCFVPASYQTLISQEGNFPVFEGTSLYSLRIDHNVSDSNRLTLRANASPSTVNGIEVSGQDQPFGQNAYSRTSQQTYRDAAGMAQDTWTIGNNKVNELRFQFAPPRIVILLQHSDTGGLRSRGQHSRLCLFRTRTLLLHSAGGKALSIYRQFFLDDWPSRHQVRRRFQLSSNLRDLHRQLWRRVRFRNHLSRECVAYRQLQRPGRGSPNQFQYPWPLCRAGLWLRSSGRFHSGRRQSQRLIYQQTFGIVLAGFVARSQEPHSELRRALRRGISA